VALDPEVRRTFEASGERVVRASLNRRHPAVREWLEEKEAARSQAKRLKRNLIRSFVAIVFSTAVAAVVLIVVFGHEERFSSPNTSADASFPSTASPDTAR
jgi:hypothetical protein